MDTKEKKEHRKQRDSRDFRTDTVSRRREKRDNMFREKRQNKKISLAFSLQRALQSFLVRCVWEIRILFN